MASQFASSFDGFASNMSFDKMADALGSRSPFTPELTSFLAKVYMTLSLGGAMATVGTVAYMHTHLSYMMPLILSLICIYCLHTTDKAMVEKRLGYFSLVCFCQGYTIGSLVEVALIVDSSLVAMALGTTMVLFLGFTTAALTAKRRSYLYLGGMLYSSLGFMSLIGFLNIFFRSQMLYNIPLYGGLVVFSGYVIFDTQLMIEKFHSGNKDFIGAALELFLDLAAIFVRILIILLKNKENESRRKKPAGRAYG
mmetsp:Transcript_3987/g.5807  ORF Transcript_3987/g.5807 Transcript_3987/m.5807 type:complete len:253 (-) Transcript_3987:81-839(-)